ncbi:MAG: YggS family pyridoxal phosphate-dependent enzyme [Bacteroidetes bacterium]|nr:YggS family pyridoxal phosphate-dependent enzyme [Bacteroidota bacterium]
MKSLELLNELQEANIKLVAVSKTKPIDLILEYYNASFRVFGENRVHEFVDKYEKLPKDIEWHFLGHLQTNKVKYIAPFVNLIHSVDSWKVLKEINKQAKKNERIIDCLLQFKIGREESKYGLDMEKTKTLFESDVFQQMNHIRIIGVMGMATFTNDKNQIRQEFRRLKHIFTSLRQTYFQNEHSFKEISMGMSGDYQIAIEEGSTMVRIGSLIFGPRNRN